MGDLRLLKTFEMSQEGNWLLVEELVCVGRMEQEGSEGPWTVEPQKGGWLSLP